MPTDAARTFAERVLPERPNLDLHWVLSGRAFIQATYVLVETDEGLSGAACEMRCRELLAGPLNSVLESMRQCVVPQVARVARVLDELTDRERVSILAVAATAAMHHTA